MNDAIEDFTWVTFKSTHIDDGFRPYHIDDGGYHSHLTQVHGVTPNFFDVLDSTRLKVPHHSDSKLSLGEQLYTPRGT